MNPWGPYGIPAWMAIWAEILSPSSYQLSDRDVISGFYTDEQIETSVKELREDLRALTPDDLTIGRGR